MMSPDPGRFAQPVAVGAVGVPALVQPRRSRQISRNDLLYRIYLVVVFAAIYGYALGRAIELAQVAPWRAPQLAVAGALLATSPAMAALAGIRFGRWAGPVPISRTETSILLPTLVDRRELLVPRLYRSYAAAAAVGAVAGFAATVLVALNLEVAIVTWVAIPAVCAASGLTATGVSAVAQSFPLDSGYHRRSSIALIAISLIVAVTNFDHRGRHFFVQVADNALGFGSGLVLAAMLAIATTLAVAGAFAGRAAIGTIHDEELTSRAGLHAGLAASAQLGDLRAIALSREPTMRSRAHRTPAAPRHSSGAIFWRHITVLRACPIPVIRCAIGWILATLVLVLSPETAGVAAHMFRSAIAGSVLYAGVVPLLEPLRREHDAPLACEILPFGFAKLALLHFRAALVIVTTVGFLSVAPTLIVTGHGSLVWTLVAIVPFVALTATLVVADRIRHAASLPEIIAALPAGAMPEAVGLTMLMVVVQPVLAMLPAALPAGLALSAGGLGLPVAAAVGIGAVLGASLLAMNVLGLWLWLNAYERALEDGEVLEATGTLVLAWRRLRDRRSQHAAS